LIISPKYKNHFTGKNDTKKQVAAVSIRLAKDEISHTWLKKSYPFGIRIVYKAYG
jgi:hypothetical protein